MDKYIHEIINLRSIQRYVLPIGILLWGAATTSARAPSVRHVPGVKSIGIHGGFTALGKALPVDYTYHFAPHWKIKGEIGVELDRFRHHTYRSIFIQPVLGYTLYSNHKYWFITALGGARLHIESHQPKNKSKEKQTHAGNIALVTGGETELFLMKNIALSLTGGLRLFLLKSPYGKVDYFLNMGLRIDF